MTDPAQPEPLPSDPALSFDDVWLTYPGGAQPALRGVSLHLAAGDKLALTGPSGRGKSTLLSLVGRVWDPNAGCVRLGGVDLRTLALADVRSCSAWAAQTPQLVSGSIADNLRLARPGASDDELNAVLEQVGLAAFVAADRLYAWVGDGGDRLSAGERSRVGVAQALLSPAPILLLDEPTAHLDQHGAAQLLEVVSRLDRAVLLVTHSPDLLGAGWRVLDLAESEISCLKPETDHLRQRIAADPGRR